MTEYNSDDEIDREVDEILSKMTPDPTKVLVPGKKPRKPRGPASEKQKAALAEGRKRKAEASEIRKLEKAKKRAADEKKLAKLKREVAAREEPDPTDEEIKGLKKQLDELKQQVSKPTAQPIINVHAAAPATAPIPPADDDFQKKLRRYCKV